MESVIPENLFTNGGYGYNISDSAMSQYVNLIQAQSEELWNREDTAYQRMVADMKAAGLNPWLGVSSGGLSAGSNVPALDSLTGLISVLSNNINATDKSLNFMHKQEEVGIQALDMGINLLRALGSSVGAMF